MADADQKVFLYGGKRLDEWLPEVVERIVKRFDPLRVILFGSLARGEANYHSDVDLLVVFEEVKREDKREVAVEIRRALADLPVSKDILVTDLEEISRRGKIVGTVLHEALQEGKVLHDRCNCRRTLPGSRV
jgi:predicted nucleotidyltransferase